MYGGGDQQVPPDLCDVALGSTSGAVIDVTTVLKSSRYALVSERDQSEHPFSHSVGTSKKANASLISGRRAWHPPIHLTRVATQLSPNRWAYAPTVHSDEQAHFRKPLLLSESFCD